MEENFAVVDNCLLVKVPNELDHHQAAGLRQLADRYLMDERVENLVFDFGETTFMDSSGIGMIAGRYKKVACFGGKVMILHANERIKRIIALSGLNGMIEWIEE